LKGDKKNLMGKEKKGQGRGWKAYRGWRFPGQGKKEAQSGVVSSHKKKEDNRKEQPKRRKIKSRRRWVKERKGV